MSASNPSGLATSSESGVATHANEVPAVLPNGETEIDEGNCSDSDALLPSAKQPLSAEPTVAGSTNSNPQRCRNTPKKQSAPARADKGIFGEEREACSPLLLRSQCQTQIPGLTSAASPPATTDDDSASSSLVSNPHSHQSEGQKSSHSTIPENESTTSDQQHTDENSSSSNAPIDASIRWQQRATQPSPISGPHTEPSSTILRDSPVQRSRITAGIGQQYSSSTSLPQDQDHLDPLSQFANLPFGSSNQEEGFLPNSTLDNGPFVPIGTHSVSSAATSDPSNTSREATGLGIRRFVRSRVSARTRTTTGSSSSQISTQSLGDEDLFALALTGDDPRLPANSNSPVATPQPPSQRDLWDAARLESSEQFPPIVWEDREASDSEAEIRERRALRTFSEPSVNRLRGFRLPRAISRASGMRQRGSRQSRSVRQHLPRSSTASSPNLASPLSTTAAAVLFTSSQASQASVDSLRQSRRSQQQSRRPRGAQQRLSTASLDDSARAMGTSHRSIAIDGGGNDALSVSTIGNSTIARSDVAASTVELGRQSLQTSGPPVSARENSMGQDDAGEDNNSANSDDPEREARVRWIRINQRFQLLITFAAVCFSLLLFSIIVSWIIMTFYFIMSFQKGEECDIPLRFWYWLVTLELVIDVFRNDIMRYVLQWDPAAQSPGNSQRFIPARIVAYNVAYLAYAMLVLRMGINCVYIDGQKSEFTCNETAPGFFKSALVFVTLELAAWANIVLGYLVPFCFVATLLTLNGYNPREAEDGPRIGASPIPGGVFPSAYSINGAPPGTVELLRVIDVNDCEETECCICMEDFRKRGRHDGDGAIVRLDCGHVLHKACCSVWLRQARTCPVCRTDIPNAQAERLQQQQLELGDSSQNLHQQNEQGRRSQRHPQQRTTVAPHLPFRPAGRQEVATLIRAFRQPGSRHRSGQRSGGRSRRASAAERSGSFADGSRNRVEQPLDHSEEAAGGIEITTTINRRGNSSSSVHTSEGNHSAGQRANADGAIPAGTDFVL